MSKIAPLNATIEVKKIDGQRFVRKRYHAKYTAVEEQEAYANVEKICVDIEGIRIAMLYDVDKADNSLLLEYIAGPSLYEVVLEANVVLLDKFRPSLVELFVRAREKGVRFDSDPSNLMYDESAEEIIIIDPICVRLDIADFPIVVFLWGLIKLMLRNRRFWNNRKVMQSWYSYYRDYLQRTGLGGRQFNRQMAEYINIVVRWNMEGNLIEGPAKRMVRQFLVVPVYTIIKWLFQWNLARL